MRRIEIKTIVRQAKDWNEEDYIEHLCINIKVAKELMEKMKKENPDESFCIGNEFLWIE